MQDKTVKQQTMRKKRRTRYQTIASTPPIPMRSQCRKQKTKEMIDVEIASLKRLPRRLRRHITMTTQNPQTLPKPPIQRPPPQRQTTMQRMLRPLLATQSAQFLFIRVTRCRRGRRRPGPLTTTRLRLESRGCCGVHVVF